MYILIGVFLCVWTAVIFFVGYFYGQGVQIGFLMNSRDETEVSVGKHQYEVFQYGLKIEKGLFWRLAIRLVLRGITDVSQMESRDA